MYVFMYVYVYVCIYIHIYIYTYIYIYRHLHPYIHVYRQICLTQFSNKSVANTCTHGHTYIDVIPIAVAELIN